MTRQREAGRIRAAVVLGCVALGSCERHTAPAHRSARAWPAAVAECDPAGFVGCIQDAATISIPIVNTGLSLTYSSGRGADSSDRTASSARALGLGGWSVNAVARYDRSHGILMEGDGSWHAVSAVPLPAGGSAVPSYDGSVAYVFDAAGRHVRTVDGRLGTSLLTIGYDSAGRLSRVDGLVGDQPVHVAVQRASGGAPRALVGADSAASALDIDASERLASITDPAGRRTDIAWRANGPVTAVTNPLGAVTRYEFDSAGDLTAMTDADQVTTRFERVDLTTGFEVRAVTGLGRRWVYRAETVDRGLRRTLIAPDGSTTTETVDGGGTRTIDLPNGRRYTVGAVAGPRWGAGAPILTPIVERRPDGATSRREVRELLQPQEGRPFVVAGSVTTTINGQAWTETVDPDRRTTTLVDPLGRRTTSTYDAAGRLIRRSSPGAATRSYTYDAQGRTASETVGADALAATTTYRYDPSTGSVTVTRPDGAVETTAFDGAGRAVSISAADGSTVLASYDAAGRLSLLLPAGRANFAVGTSPAGRPTAFIPPPVAADSSIEITAYDRDGAARAITGLGQRAVNIVRDAAGRVTGVTFDRGSRSVSYEARSGLVSEARDPSGLVTRYGYSGGVPVGLAWSGPVRGSVAESLDVNARPVAELVNGTKTLSFAYDASGQLTGVGPLVLTRDASSGLVTHTVLGVVETSQEFDANGQLVRSTTRAGGKAVLDDRYGRDTQGRTQVVVETMDGTTATTEYSYDRAGRLATVRADHRVVETATYDAAGNRVNVARPTGAVAATYDDRDRVLSWGALRYAWAPDGSLQRAADTAHEMVLRYDDFGSLREATVSGGGPITYLVDADGRRVGRQVDGKLAEGYLYRPDGLLAAELDSAGRVERVFGYDDAGHLALVVRGGATYRVITDPIGSPRLVIDARTGAVTDAVSYDASGNPREAARVAALPVGFAGGLRDPATGLLLFGARDYDPTTGRWTAADPIGFDGGDGNLYRYAAGDPVNRVDPTGLAPKGGTPPRGGKPPNSGKPPNTGSPNTGTPPGTVAPNPNLPPDGSSGPTWHCSSPQGSCLPPPGGGNWGCTHGECGNNGSGFWCKAQLCQGPHGDLCIGSASTPCSYGEPHLRTGRGGKFDFQATGEFIAATSGGDFVIQVRQEALSPGSDVAINTAVAANVNGDRVGVYAKEPSFVLVNDAPGGDADFVRGLPHGGTIRRRGANVEIGWPDGGRLTVGRFGRLLDYAFAPSAQAAPTVRGLLPSADSGESHSYTGRDGLVLDAKDPAFPAKLYQQYGNSWRIKPPESLFHYWPGETTAGFTDPHFPGKRVTAGSLPPATRARAETTCRAVGIQSQPTLDDCIVDVGVSGSPAMAAASVAAAGAPAYAATASAAPPPSPAPAAGGVVYAIRIGDTVSAARPAPGAGLTSPDRDTQAYSFEARGGEIVYVEVPPCAGAPLTFEVRDAANRVLGGRSGCGDVGPLTLPAAGVYRVFVRSDRASARYTFALRLATFDTYSISVGDSVSPDHPSRGAGVIAQAGSQQAYAFRGRAGQIVYVHVGPCDGASPPAFEVRDPGGRVIGGQGGCQNFGPITLATDGLYRMVVRAERGPVRYALSLRATTLDRYSINVGDSVAPGHPSSGAGLITQLGERQSFAFPARAGQAVYLGIGPCQGPAPVIDLMAPDGRRVDGQIGCHDLGRVDLPSTGVYHVEARADGPTRYGFVLRAVPPDKHFTVRLPVAVSPDAPVRGAGRMVAPGAQQFYDFTGRPGSAVHLEATCSQPCPNLSLRVTRAGDRGGYGFVGLMFMKQDWPLAPGDSYTIEVLSNGYVGDYGFTASPAGPLGR